MPIDRRSMIKAIGAALCAGAVPKFVPELVGGTVGIGRPDAKFLDDDLFHIHHYDAMHGFMRYWTTLVIKPSRYEYLHVAST